MKKTATIVGVLIGLVLLVVGFYFSTRNRVSVEFVEGDYNPANDSSVVMAWDEEGNLIYEKENNLKDSTLFVKSKLNGEVFYIFSKTDSGWVKTGVFKYQHRKEDFAVTFNNDTLNANNPFEATISVSGLDSHNIDVIVDNEGTYFVDKENGKNIIQRRYRSKGSNTGLNKFEGRVIVEGKEYPIKFRYFVK